MSSSPAARSPYFVNAPVDFLVIGGASIATFAALRLFHSGARDPWVWQLAGWLVWVVNWPHFSATSYRLYHSRANIGQYPMTALLIPVLVLAGLCASFASPDGIAPFFVKLFLIWSPYHFSGQTLGITLLYARRAGFHIHRLERLALSCFIFGTYFRQTIRAELSAAGSQYYGIQYPGLGLPPWSVWVAQGVMLSGAAIFAALLLLRWVRERRAPPAIVGLPALAQFTWFVAGSGYASFTEFVPFFHSLQYLLIAWSMQLSERLALGGFAPSRRAVWRESMRWGGLNFLGGAVLFWLLPRVFSRGSGTSLNFATGVVLAGVQIHHFFVDGVIWKLRSRRVGEPLRASLEDLVRSPPSAAAAASAVAAAGGLR